ncbi:MAG TPA: hypothetical protein DEF34_02935 [Desulfotomaculum sp.]|nr:MAG: hypothetical protein JL56_02555 [Desulfotomaculum sp. BICA1-6]HBX22582.1 hypothetical protein [Desulfotomaculum sp.]
MSKKNQKLGFEIEFVGRPSKEALRNLAIALEKLYEKNKELIDRRIKEKKEQALSDKTEKVVKEEGKE